MKLYNVYFLCKTLLKPIKNVKAVSIDNANRSFRIEQWVEYKDALLKLKRIPFFENDVENIYNGIPVFVREKEKPEIDSSVRNTFVNNNAKIATKMETIIGLYESMGLKETSVGIDVKIPKCDNLKEYISYLGHINFIFSQCPYIIGEKEELKFENVDVGSNWLKFVVKASAGAALTFSILNNTAALVDKAIVLKSHYVLLQQQQEMLESMEIKNDMAESQKEWYETLKKAYLAKAVAELEKEIYPLQDGEERGKVEQSLQRMVGLLDKGVEFYSSLDAPEEIQVLFPEIEESLELTDDILKYIVDNSMENENQQH